MGRESSQRSVVIGALRQLDAVSVENRAADPGTPDVNYIGGWLELKCLEHWPRRANTPVIIDHFTPQQRAWLRRRAIRGGIVHVLLKVGREWLLIEGRAAADNIGRCTRAQLVQLAVVHWPRGLEKRELLECLTQRSEPRSPPEN